MAGMRGWRATLALCSSASLTALGICFSGAMLHGSAAIAAADPWRSDMALDQPRSLVVIQCSQPECLRALFDHEIAVSRVEDGLALAFAARAGLAFLSGSGFEYRILETDAAGREHYIVFASPAELRRRLAPPLDLLLSADDMCVVSVPQSGAARVPELGFDITKLFRTPMHLRSQAEPWPLDIAAREIPQVAEARIESLVARISTDSLDSYVSRLQRFGSRRATKAGGRRAASWIADKLASFGYAEVNLEPAGPGIAPNVVATLRGVTSPEEIVILGGHFDSYAVETDLEPGADDNATGTAAVLECARVCAGSEFACTIRFIAFSGEELGLIGSDTYAYNASNGRDRISAMLNVDMLGYLAPGDSRDLDIIWDPPSTWLKDAAIQAAATYVPGFRAFGAKLARGSSDHASFWRYGFSAIFLHEDVQQSSPYIHTQGDSIGPSYNDPLLATLCTRVAMALLAALAGPPQVAVLVRSLEASWSGSGVELRWQLDRDAVRGCRGVEVQRAPRPEGPFAPCTATPLEPGARGSFTDTGADPGRAWWYRLALVGSDGALVFAPPIAVEPAALRTALAPVPGPIHGGPLTLRYRIGPVAARVQLDLFDVRGRLVRALARGPRPPGSYLESFDLRTEAGARLPRGAYVLRLRAAGVQESQKLVLLGR